MSEICGFVKAWIGPCKEIVKSGERCNEHIGIKCCSCGAPATHECGETGQFVCGAPLCDECTHNIHPKGHNGGIGFNALEYPKELKVHGKKNKQRFAPWYIDVDSLEEWKKSQGIPKDFEVFLTNT